LEASKPSSVYIRKRSRTVRHARRNKYRRNE
jgi:hypothetical protein